MRLRPQATMRVILGKLVAPRLDPPSHGRPGSARLRCQETSQQVSHTEGRIRSCQPDADAATANGRGGGLGPSDTMRSEL
jgi:hypothetical protein